MAGAVLVGVVVCTLVGWSCLRRYTVGFVSSVSVSYNNQPSFRGLNHL